MDQASELKLLQQLKAGAPQAVTEWYRLFYLKLHRFVLLKISTSADAEEVTQDIFLSCLKHLPLFRGESSIWTWMVHVAHHEIADYYRKRYAKKFVMALPLSEFLPTQSVHRAEDVSQRVLV